MSMEQTYATASLAVLCLLSNTVEENQRLESETVLRSVLQRRPVVLSFVVSTFAKKLREGGLVSWSYHPILIRYRYS